MSPGASPSDLQDQLEQAATDPSLTPQERTARVMYLRSQINSVLGRADAYLHDVKLAEQAEDMEKVEALLSVREAADMRAEFLRRGLATVEQLEEAGVPSHEELDRLGEEGLLMEFSLRAWKEALHPRDRAGRWREVFKALTPKGRHGRKQPEVLHSPKDKRPRADVTPQELGQKVPETPRVPRPEHAHKEETLLPHERAKLDTQRLRAMSEEERLAHYRSRASEFDRKVQELATMRLAQAFAGIGKRDPGTVVVHPEEVDDFLKGAPYGRVLYHGTPRQNVESILTSGLRGGDMYQDVKGRETVFLTSNPDLARGHGTPVPVATKLDNPLILEPGEDAGDALQRMGAANLDDFDGMVRRLPDGTEVVTAWEPKDDLKVVTDEPVIDPRKLDQAELRFNAAGSINQHTLGEFAREAAGEPDTVDLHSKEVDGKRVYSAQRRALHEKIISRLLRQKKLEDGKWVFCEDCPDYAVSDDPEVLFSGGGYSAGKGTVADKLIEQIESGYDGPVFKLDPDEIKAMLPEYQDRYEFDPLANALVYREAWDIAQEAQRRAQERKLSMVVDGISNTSPEEMIQRVRSFTDKGYRAKVVYVDIPTEEALKRARKRSETSTKKKDRRMIPTTIMRAVHRDVAATIPALVRRVQRENVPVDIEVWDNNQPPTEDGQFVQKQFFQYVAETKKAEVLDNELWAALGRKARERLPEEQGIMEAIWRPELHPRDRFGRWIDVLRHLAQPTKRDIGTKVLHPGWRRGRLETAGVTPPQPRLTEREWHPVLSHPHPPAQTVELDDWWTKSVLVRRDTSSPFEPSPRAIQHDLEQVRLLGEHDLKPTKGEAAKRILGEHPDTQAAYSVEQDGKRLYTPERQRLHREIIDLLLRQRSLDSRGKPTVLNPTGEYVGPHPDPDGHPVVVFMGGGTASGKSTVQELDEVRRTIFGEGDFVLIDPDEIKAMLPEYHDMLDSGDDYAAFGVHEESSDISKMLQRMAMERGLNVIVDGTFDGRYFDDEGNVRNPEKQRSKLRKFAEKGYVVRMLYVNAPTDLAVVRAHLRSYETGRHVAEQVIREMHEGVSQRFEHEALPALREGLISRMYGFDTSGTMPVEVFRTDGPEIIIVNEERYRAFLEKARERQME